MSTTTLYEVVEVDLDSNTVKMMSSKPETIREADAICSMATMRRGDSHNFHTVVAAGKYQTGDTYDGTGIAE
jgi:hypothetical protein